MTRIAIPCIAIPPEDAERLRKTGLKLTTRGAKLTFDVAMSELESAYELAASRPRSDYAAHLETALSEIDVPRIGALREGGEWRVTLTTGDGNSRDGAGPTFIEALLEATLAIVDMREGQGLLASEAAR
jgi:hypothetical protein